VTDLPAQYLDTLGTISGGQRWYQSATPFRFAALHLTAAGVTATPDGLTNLAGDLKQVLGRADPLRGYVYPLAGLVLARRLAPERAAAALNETAGKLASGPRPLSSANRARAVPALAFLCDSAPCPDPSRRLTDIHDAWNARHRWLTTGRHYSLAAMAVAAGLEPEKSAGAAERVHDLLNEAGYWHEWDASLILSFARHGPEEAAARYLSAVQGYTGGERKPPAVARDDLAVVSLAAADPLECGQKLARYNRYLRELRPQPTRQVALALAAALVLADKGPADGSHRVVVDGFGLYAYAEALIEESVD
jgi:hypothetical protein